MKKPIWSILLLTGVLCFASCKKESNNNNNSGTSGNTNATLMNLGFENWSLQGTITPQYPVPAASWASGNPVSDDLQTALIFCKDTTFAAEGSKAALLRTIDVAGVKATGNIFTGNYFSNLAALNDPNFSPLDFGKLGVPVSTNYNSLTGKYHFIPVQGDSAMITVAMTKYNTTLAKTDTIGYGEVKFLNASPANTFEDFTLLIYYASTEPADSIQIVGLSSAGGLNLQGQAGNTLIIDDFQLN